MKKIILLGIFGFTLVSCNDGAPKCEDTVVTKTVIQILRQNSTNLQWDNGNNNVAIDTVKAKIENIMTTKVDKELKSCDCQGTVFTGIFGVSGSVTYMAQENSEGEVIVNIVNAGPFGF